MLTQEIPLNGTKNIESSTLKDDTEMLDEVVVIGYGTMKKSDMTGAISSVDVRRTDPSVPPLTPPKRCKVKSPV